MAENAPSIFPALRIWIQNLCSVASGVFSYLQPRRGESLERLDKLHGSPLCRRQNRKSGFCPREMASKSHRVWSVLSNPIPVPSHVPVRGFAAPQNRLGNSTNDLPGKSQRAAITRSFADAPLLRRAHVWFLSGRPSFSLSLSLSLPLSLHFYRALILPPVLPTSFHSFIPVLWPWQSVSFSLLARLPVASWACLSLHHTSASSFTFKSVLVGC